MEILIIIALVLLNGIFAMSEMALVSSRKFKLENMGKKGAREQRKLLNSQSILPSFFRLFRLA